MQLTCVPINLILQRCSILCTHTHAAFRTAPNIKLSPVFSSTAVSYTSVRCVHTNVSMAGVKSQANDYNSSQSSIHASAFASVHSSLSLPHTHTLTHVIRVRMPSKDRRWYSSDEIGPISHASIHHRVKQAKKSLRPRLYCKWSISLRSSSSFRHADMSVEDGRWRCQLWFTRPKILSLFFLFGSMPFR